MSDYDVGLVVGKFCPLHQGHQRLLDHAQARCRALVVVSYTKPEFDGMEPARREQWLRELYPSAQHWVLDDDRLAAHCRRLGRAAQSLPANDADDATQHLFMAFLLREVVRTQVDAVFTNEDYGPGFAQALSREQIQRGGHGVAHVAVGPPRGQGAASGTRLRQDIHAHRRWLSPVVYRHFVRRVALLGGESTGKSTLAHALARHCHSVCADEYGRELWQARGGELSQADLLHIAQTQIEREQTLLAAANGWLVCDTTPLTTLLYAQAMFGRAAPQLQALAQRRYDATLLCAPDFPFVQDGTRRDAAFRQWQHEWYVHQLQARGIPFMNLHGTVRQRLAAALRAMT